MKSTTSKHRTNIPRNRRRHFPQKNIVKFNHQKKRRWRESVVCVKHWHGIARWENGWGGGLEGWRRESESQTARDRDCESERVCICVCIWVCVSMCVSISVCACMCVLWCVRVCVCAHVRARICSCVCGCLSDFAFFFGMFALLNCCEQAIVHVRVRVNMFFFLCVFGGPVSVFRSVSGSLCFCVSVCR